MVRRLIGISSLVTNQQSTFAMVYQGSAWLIGVRFETAVIAPDVPQQHSADALLGNSYCMEISQTA